MKSLVALSLCLGTSGCAALLDSALSAAQKTFLNAADKNYGNAYHDDLDKLLKKMVEEPKAPAPAPAAASAPTPVPDPVPAPAPAPTPVAVSGPLELEIVILKEELIGDRPVRVPLRDGDTIFDKYGTHGDGDPLKISFRVNQECFVYVIGIDTTADMNPLFPNPKYSAHVNPAQPGVTYEVPEGDDWVGLDSFRGIEHFYFLASRTRRLDLEAQLVAMAKSAPRPLDPSRAKSSPDLAAAETVKDHVGLPRGVGEKRPGLMPSAQSGSGKSDPVPSQVFGARGDGDILVTRWFRHE